MEEAQDDQGILRNAWQAHFPIPKAGGPAEITEKIAEDFKAKYDKGRFTRKRNVADWESAPEYIRKKKSLDSRIRSLKAIFAWFKKPRLVE